jgi:hypothetical protein
MRHRFDIGGFPAIPALKMHQFQRNRQLIDLVQRFVGKTEAYLYQ